MLNLYFSGLVLLFYFLPVKRGSLWMAQAKTTFKDIALENIPRGAQRIQSDSK